MKMLVVLFLVFLGACASTSKSSNNNKDADQMMRLTLAYLSSKCSGYGFAVGTAEHSMCMKGQARELKRYLEKLEVEDKAKSESFYRDIK